MKSLRRLQKLLTPSTAAAGVLATALIFHDDTSSFKSSNISRSILLPTHMCFDHVRKSVHCDSNGDKGNNHILSRNFIADCVDIASPSVVNVLCESAIAGTFGTLRGASSGSGFIISEDGFIVTNAHVVQHNSSGGRVLLTMWDGTKRNGVVHSLDQATDIALIKLTDVKYNEDLPCATLGSSSKLRAGEFVVALGSPLLLQNSVTFGIVSSVARQGTELGMRGSRLEYIQTDASINQGNSGGPLVNLDGHVVGINAMKAAATEGISFAIPIDLAQRVIRQLKANKRVIRPFIGINMVNFNPAKNRRIKKGDTHVGANEVQVLVVSVERGSPADIAGVKANDIIVEVDGLPLKGVQTLLNAIGVDIGRRIELKLLRDGNDLRTVFVTTTPHPGADN